MAVTRLRQAAGALPEGGGGQPARRPAALTAVYRKPSLGGGTDNHAASGPPARAALDPDRDLRRLTKSYIGIALIRAAGSALLAIFLWPLVLLGVNLHIH